MRVLFFVLLFLALLVFVFCYFCCIVLVVCLFFALSLCFHWLYVCVFNCFFLSLRCPCPFLLWLCALSLLGIFFVVSCCVFVISLFCLCLLFAVCLVCFVFVRCVVLCLFCVLFKEKTTEQGKEKAMKNLKTKQRRIKNKQTNTRWKNKETIKEKAKTDHETDIRKSKNKNIKLKKITETTQDNQRTNPWKSKQLTS